MATFMKTAFRGKPTPPPPKPPASTPKSPTSTSAPPQRPSPQQMQSDDGSPRLAGAMPQVQAIPPPVRPEVDYLEERFTEMSMSVPLPVPMRGIAGRQPQGSEACRVMIGANKANIEWSNFFCTGNSAGCASKYQTGSLMEARPQGIIYGRPLIENFWKGVHQGNPGPIRYTNMRMRVIDVDTVTFSSDWTFNNMRGIIMLETWKKMPDGTYELDEDRFKIEEVYASPKVATAEEARVGLAPCHVINEVMEAMAKRIDMFNSGDVEGYINMYTPNAIQTIDPTANCFGRDEIRKLSSFYINNRHKFGSGFLTINNFSVKVMSPTRVHVSGDWNLGNNLFGYINIQQYMKQPNGKWLLELDDWTMAPHEFLY